MSPESAWSHPSKVKFWKMVRRVRQKSSNNVENEMRELFVPHQLMKFISIPFTIHPRTPMRKNAFDFVPTVTSRSQLTSRILQFVAKEAVPTQGALAPEGR